LAQCQWILPNGERCSNQTVPGAEVCETHRRAGSYTGISKIAETQVIGDGDGQTWKAVPWIMGTPLHFQGVEADSQSILTAAEGCLVLAREGKGVLFRRLVQILGVLSQITPLEGHVAVLATTDGQRALLALKAPAGMDRVRFYDVVAAAAVLAQGRLYIGQDRWFIRYRDGLAPRGYDCAVGTAAGAAGEVLYFVDVEGTFQFPWRELTAVALDRFLLRAALISRHETPGLPEKAFVLAVPALYSLLVRYLQSHHLKYRVARFHLPQDDSESGGNGAAVRSRKPLLLLEIAPRPNAPTGTRLPAFVLSYLADLPRCVVLEEVGHEGGRRMLVAWGYRYPCQPRGVMGLFPQDSLLLFSAGVDFTNMCVTPAPAFFEGDDLSDPYLPGVAVESLVPQNEAGGLALELPVRLISDEGPAAAVRALLLDGTELEWLRRLLYRLPGDLFEGYTIFLGQERAILVGEKRAIEGIPFGFPLRRLSETALFVPWQMRLVPDMPWEMLARALKIQDDVYTFLLPEARLDVPRAGFAPLERSVMGNQARRLTLQVQPVSTPPVLDWAMPETSVTSAPVPAPAPTAAPVSASPMGGVSGFLQRLLGVGAEPAAEPVRNDPEVPVFNREHSQAFNKDTWLRAQAASYLKTGDYLAAAFCYALLNDAENAGHYYRMAARELQGE